MQKSKRLQHYVNMSWLIPGSVALIASLCLFFAFGTYNYFRDLETAQTELESKVQTLARRLSGELLIAPRGSPRAVTTQVADELGLIDVIYGSEKMIAFSPQDKNRIYAVTPVPFLEEDYSLRAAMTRPPFFEHFNFYILLCCFLLIGFIVGFGIFLQSRYLRRHLIRPIESLIDTSTGEKSLCDNWPTELQDISRRLNDSFQERERVVFSQIANGVVHDIKTILQSFKVATDLAIESPTENRIKNLLSVSQRKLPTLLELIDTTLDGSREISVSKLPHSINQTLHRSVENVRALSASAKVEIDFESPTQEMIIDHDPIQVERVFTNILKNGIEAIDEHSQEMGKLRISFKIPDKNFL
ncbi:MAG: sensor histidine kinase, partial [Pseudobdellovibrionaceae bacterium]